MGASVSRARREALQGEKKMFPIRGFKKEMVQQTRQRVGRYCELSGMAAEKLPKVAIPCLSESSLSCSKPDDLFHDKRKPCETAWQWL